MDVASHHDDAGALARRPLTAALSPSAPQKQRLTVIAARFFEYGCRGSHLKTVGMALQVRRETSDTDM